MILTPKQMMLHKVARCLFLQKHFWYPTTTPTEKKKKSQQRHLLEKQKKTSPNFIDLQSQHLGWWIIILDGATQILLIFTPIWGRWTHFWLISFRWVQITNWYPIGSMRDIFIHLSASSIWPCLDPSVTFSRLKWPPFGGIKVSLWRSYMFEQKTTKCR